MAKRECPFCKESVKDTASICKHCRSELPPLPEKKWYQTWNGLLAIIFGIGMIGSMFQANVAPRSPSETPEQIAAKQAMSDSIDARTFAKLHVEKHLKTPATAKWPNPLEFAVAQERDKKGTKIKDVWKVSGYVDSQNSFGAMLRQKWYVKMKKQGQNWSLLDIQFE